MKKIYIMALLVILGIGGYCLKKVPVPPALRDIHFHNALPVFWGQGGHFYRVQLGSPLITVQQIAYYPQKSKITLSVKGFKMHIIDLLAGVSDLHGRLQSYVPYRDILAYPLESLALAGFDTLQGNLICEEQGTASPYTQIDCHFDGDVNVKIHLSCLKGLQESWDQITCPDMTVIVPWNVVERYQGYATGRQYPCPVEKQDFITLHLAIPGALKDMLNNNTKVQVLQNL